MFVFLKFWVCWVRDHGIGKHCVTSNHWLSSAHCANSLLVCVPWFPSNLIHVILDHLASFFCFLIQTPRGYLKLLEEGTVILECWLKLLTDCIKKCLTYHDAQRGRSMRWDNATKYSCCRLPVYVEEKALSTLAYLCDGDARTGLNGLQLAVQARLAAGKTTVLSLTKGCSVDGVLITEEHVKEGLQRSHILYDRAGEYLTQFLQSSIWKSLHNSHYFSPLCSSCSDEAADTVKSGLKTAFSLH